MNTKVKGSRRGQIRNGASKPDQRQWMDGRDANVAKGGQKGGGQEVGRQKEPRGQPIVADEDVVSRRDGYAALSPRRRSQSMVLPGVMKRAGGATKTTARGTHGNSEGAGCADRRYRAGPLSRPAACFGAACGRRMWMRCRAAAPSLPPAANQFMARSFFFRGIRRKRHRASRAILRLSSARISTCSGKTASALWDTPREYLGR